MTIPKLNHIHATSIINEILTEGHSPLKVTGSDFNIYIAKNAKGEAPAIHIINEILAKCFLDLWGLPTADFAVMNISKELITNENLTSLYHKPHYYETPCFASKWVENSVDLNDFLLSQNKKTFKLFHNPVDFLRISLFDEWIENDDRKPSNYNLILEPVSKKYKITPIDHAFIFSTLSYKYLDPKTYCARANDHLMISELGNLIRNETLIDKEVIEREKEYFYICISKCLSNFDTILNSVRQHFDLEEKDANSIKNFIFDSDRNRKVFQEHIYRLRNA